MRCPPCGKDVYPGAFRAACGVALGAGGARAILHPGQSVRTGPGEPWLQTRNLQPLAGALFPLFPSQQPASRLGGLLGD